MKNKIDYFFPCASKEAYHKVKEALKNECLINNIFGLVQQTGDEEATINPYIIKVEGIESTNTLQKIAQNATANYVLLAIDALPITLHLGAINRLCQVANDTNASVVYADYQEKEGEKRTLHPLIDYQIGSVRDDFDFGKLVLIRTESLKKYVEKGSLTSYLYSGWYDFRLSQHFNKGIFHLKETLYTVQKQVVNEEGEEQFNYVNPANRAVQIERETVVTQFLKETKALINPQNYCSIDLKKEHFAYEASVVIPVFNREKTIKDAVLSALSQKTQFAFNVIVVDNHSTDNTTKVLQELAKEHKHLVHLIPNADNLGIGGCWNYAIMSDYCGRFAVQLDSDDLYSSHETLQKIVDCFYQTNAAMVIGSYRLCDFNLETLPPGLISHSEWTDDNGANNALRINGLGAPRAFYTPVLRSMAFPNTSYGEDYAVALRISRNYKIGRIYDELYLCRRWGGNSDSNLSVELLNKNNAYKDQIRSIELSARMSLNAKQL